MKYRIFYRISGQTDVSAKSLCKSYCLNNFFQHFDKSKTTIIADNCSEQVLDIVKNYTQDYTITNLGNSGSFMFCWDRAIQEANNVDFFYFVEDDYLHRNNAFEVLKDGLQYADYVSLYDHPDKYTINYRMGETCKLSRSRYCHWKNTVSTTMTFAVHSAFVKIDRDAWIAACQLPIPADHWGFLILEATRRRKLNVPVPGFAYHVDFNSILQGDWWMDSWLEQHKELLPEKLREKLTFG